MTSGESKNAAIPVMIGTAGHVDHGKTSLVRQLTNFNTDTLKEEQERGMSIDFGVAPCSLALDNLSDQRIVGIIDVPGHRDFIRNMVAGASSVDVLMLVVSADDSIMPQTIEHVKIASMLGMSKALVVITKIDLVDSETLEIVEQDVIEFVEKAGFSEVPVLKVSNQTGEGISKVRETLARLVAEVERKEEPAKFRMYVRKAFTLKGYGTVVTGVPQSGEVAVGKKLELLPSGKICTVRAIQNYRQEMPTARANISTAINLRDVEPAEFERGMALIEPGSTSASKYLVIWLKNQNENLTLKHRCDVRFHVGTAGFAAHARVLKGISLGPEQEGLLALRLEQAVVCAPGDKTIVRTLSPAETVGGGIVVAKRHSAVRASARTIENLMKAQAEINAGDLLSGYLYGSEQPIVGLRDIMDSLQWDEAFTLSQIKRLEKSGQLQSLKQDSWLLASRASELQKLLERRLELYHRQTPLSLGMKDSFVCELLNAPANSFQTIWEKLSDNSKFNYNNKILSLKTFKPQITETEILLREAIINAVNEAGSQTVAQGNLQQELGCNQKDWRKILKLLTEGGEIVQLGNNLISKSVIDKFESILLEIFQKQEIVELKDFRDATETSRNVAVLTLEYFDVQGLTKRRDKGRVLQKKA